jgi:hypothetical protein
VGGFEGGQHPLIGPRFLRAPEAALPTQDGIRDNCLKPIPQQPHRLDAARSCTRCNDGTTGTTLFLLRRPFGVDVRMRRATKDNRPGGDRGRSSLGMAHGDSLRHLRQLVLHKRPWSGPFLSFRIGSS